MSMKIRHCSLSPYRRSHFVMKTRGKIIPQTKMLNLLGDDVGQEVLPCMGAQVVAILRRMLHDCSLRTKQYPWADCADAQKKIAEGLDKKTTQRMLQKLKVLKSVLM